MKGTHMRYVYLFALGLASLCAGQNLAAPSPTADADGAAPAPAPAPPPAPANAPPKPLQIGPVTVTGSLRARLYVWDWFEAPPYRNQYENSGNLLRVSFAE